MIDKQFCFLYNAIVVSSEGILLVGSDMLDKAQIERSVLYPAFLLLGSKKKSKGKETIWPRHSEAH